MLECENCGGGIDDYGDTLEPNYCGWGHDSDCEVCGRSVCDQSC